jgi:DNA-binding transcriptional MocR family regulator
MVRNIIRGRTSAAIASSIENALQAGHFQPEQRLPPIRRLAAMLRVSPVTVATAYRHLQRRGLLTAGGRRGTQVRSTPPAAAPRGPRSSSAASPAAEGLVDLATGNPDPAMLPPLEPVLRSVAAGTPLYGGAPNLPSLAAFAAEEFAADGIPAESIAVLGGALDAIERLLREELRPGDRVGVEDPSPPALLDLIGSAGFVAQPMAVDADGPEPGAFEEALIGARAVIVTPRAQNPTGAAMSRERAGSLLNVLRRRDDLLLVENDPAGPVSGVPAVTLAAVHAESGFSRTSLPRWAVVRSVSKFLGPDLRVALVAGDALTIARVQGRHALGSRWVSHL